MVVDGLPTGGGLVEQYLHEKLEMDHFLANTVSVRLTQLLGRIIRGRQDYGFFIIADRRVENWLKNERNRSLLPELLRRQLYLSEEIEKQVPGAMNAASVLETMQNVLNRDQGWVDFYRDNINELDVSEARLKDNTEEDSVMSEAGKCEVRFATKLWDNDIAGARSELESIFKEAAIHDARLAGWYSLWIGMTFYAEGNVEAAIDMFDESRSRLGYNLPLPRRKVAAREDAPIKTCIEKAIRDLALGNVSKVNDAISKLQTTATDAFSATASHRQAEEAVRVIGAAFGFSSSRPCNDDGQGPDNLWIDILSKSAIAFELKTEKAAGNTITKEDVGQGLNHLEWIKAHYSGLALVGLIFLSDCQNISDKSNPSDKMYLGTQRLLKSVWEEFLDHIVRIRPRTDIEKIADAIKIGNSPEWSIDGLFRRLVLKKMS